ncbi:prolyl oligopeptidase family protein [Pleionea sp. CnH1-48]|uniref:prolyl oligopeptidase family serine peptidase n=1 Tax=Pleionea sp. CnH1-48 TaxID=2954494 RepID=UPI0020975950|nr:prolyl oligopeptidase family serine peptidase [Pleionea sp. CnH1-48]MCO7226709.1 prolyl oligopeptidase family serine peptidase [Pleionea sp. CnH1-48]
MKIKTNLQWLTSVALVSAAIAGCSHQPVETPSAEKVAHSAQQVKDTDFLWLEGVEDKRALNWVEEHNKVTHEALATTSHFKELYSKNLDVYQSNERIPYITQRGEYYYNFWQDAEHQRGIYRRTTLSSYKSDNPQWEVVIDFDALAKQENENWVYKGMNCLYPKEILCLVNLSRGGADATVVREFNMKTKSFVENGFKLAEAKSSIAWIDSNTVFVGTDFGEGSLTESGYTRIVKRWKRGTPLADAKTVYEAKPESIYAYGARFFSKDGSLDMLVEAPTFFTNVAYVLTDKGRVKIQKPDNAVISGYFNKQAFISLKSDWNVNGKIFKQGSVITIPMEDLLAGKKNFELFAAPSQSNTIAGISFTKSYVLVSWLKDVKSSVSVYKQDKSGKWQSRDLPFDANGRISVFGTNENSEQFFLSYESFLQPDSFYIVNGKNLKSEKLRQLPAFFDASKYETAQHFATSKDGTKVPYFIVKPKGMSSDSSNPTLLYGYGGFEVSLRPSYSSTVGIDWLEQGGVYVLANIRGGGEYGPAWHQAALKQNRHKAYEDFEAVAEDLIQRKVTSPKHLGIQGGSNGGLLMGAMLTRRPELFNAIVCQVPLLDMLRFHKLLAGASWVGEYGSPDIEEERKYLASYSPFHQLTKTASYPKVLFTTSTRDDRVHPGHARKMVAKMEALGHDVFYYENTEGGHGGAANQKQSAYLNAMVYTYLMDRLK